MPDHVIPEIKRTSLTSVVLTLKCLAIHDVIRYVDSFKKKKNVLGWSQVMSQKFFEVFGSNIPPSEGSAKPIKRLLYVALLERDPLLIF